VGGDNCGFLLFKEEEGKQTEKIGFTVFFCSYYYLFYRFITK